MNEALGNSINLLIFIVCRLHICDGAWISHRHGNLHVSQCIKYRCKCCKARYCSTCTSIFRINSSLWRL